MAPKRARATKKAAGGKATAKASTAPAKKAAASKPPARPEPREGTRRQPGRRVKGGEAPAAAAAGPNIGEDDEGEPPQSLPKSRPVRKPAAKSRDAAEDEPPAQPSKATGGKRPAPAEDSEDSGDDVPLIKRSRTTRSRAHVVEEDEDDGQLAAEGPEGPVQGQDPAPEEQNGDAQEGEQEGELTDNAENYPDCSDLAEDTQLARVEISNVSHTFRGDNPTDVTLRFRLEVYPDPQQTQCRLFYRLRFYLTRADQEEEIEAGYIHAYRIAKTTAAHRNAENRSWITELMPKNLKSVRQDIRETAICLRALFNLTGEPSATKIRNADRQRSLRDNALLFIEMIHVRQPYQRRGLLTPLLRNWLELLQQLPEWFAFAGNVVLVPGKPDNEIGRRVWAEAEQSDEQVEDALTEVYERQGWAVWVRAAKVGDSFVRVMGRELESIPEEGEE